MNGTLVDSNVLLDVITEDPKWLAWSAAQIERLAQKGPLYIDVIVYAEVSVRYETVEEVESALPVELFPRLPLPLEAVFLAGKAYMRYKRQGGNRTSALPDFFIGAHAAVAGLRLLTRDPSRYRTYFPTLDIIAPNVPIRPANR